MTLAGGALLAAGWAPAGAEVSPGLIALIALAGLAAGFINAVVGSGTLITFPALIALGVPPVAATMTSTVGLTAGNITGSIGYRAEISAQRRRLLGILPAAVLGAILGAWLLLHLPDNAFETIVPIFLTVALLLVLFQPAIGRAQRRRAERLLAADGGAPGAGEDDATIKPGLLAFTFVTGTYGGYFAAAQGIVNMAVLGLFVRAPLQVLNGLKNIQSLAVNLVASIFYIVVGFHEIAWAYTIAIAAGALVGGYLGARVGRRFPPWLLRAAILALGLYALWQLLR